MSNMTVTRAGAGAGLQEDRWGEVLGLLGVGVVSLATTTVLVALVLRVRYSWRLEDARRLEAAAAPRDRHHTLTISSKHSTLFATSAASGRCECLSVDEGGSSVRTSSVTESLCSSDSGDGEGGFLRHASRHAPRSPASRATQDTFYFDDK